MPISAQFVRADSSGPMKYVPATFMHALGVTTIPPSDGGVTMPHCDAQPGSEQSSRPSRSLSTPSVQWPAKLPSPSPRLSVQPDTSAHESALTTIQNRVQPILSPLARGYLPDVVAESSARGDTPFDGDRG